MYIVHMQTSGYVGRLCSGQSRKQQQVRGERCLKISSIQIFEIQVSEYQVSKEESDRSERYSKRQEPKHNCLGFISQHFNKIYHCGVWTIL